MKISVVVPVFNASDYVWESVTSALSQSEVDEVLLIEDASHDDSYAVCEKLQKYDQRVKLMVHEGHSNKGPGESRNLGMITARNPFVAFLDADDFYLPNRFEVTKQVFFENPDADAVCEGVGTAFKDDDSRLFWLGQGFPELTTLNRAVSPEQFFWVQEPMGSGGYAHTNGWTIKKEIFARVGYFNPQLRLHQDTDFFMRLAMVGNVYAGKINAPVAMRRLHNANRITAYRSADDRFVSRLDMWLSTLRWSESYQKNKERKALLAKLAGHVCAACLSRHNEYAQRLGIVWAASLLYRRHPRIFLMAGFYTNILSFIRRRARSKAKFLLRRRSRIHSQ